MVRPASSRDRRTSVKCTAPTVCRSHSGRLNTISTCGLSCNSRSIDSSFRSVSTRGFPSRYAPPNPRLRFCPLRLQRLHPRRRVLVLRIQLQRSLVTRNRQPSLSHSLIPVRQAVVHIRASRKQRRIQFEYLQRLLLLTTTQQPISQSIHIRFPQLRLPFLVLWVAHNLNRMLEASLRNLRLQRLDGSRNSKPHRIPDVRHEARRDVIHKHL